MLDKRNYYRFPWSMNDNPIAWIEVTDICNIHCEGCYRQHMTGHKSLEQLKEEVLFFKQWRNPDNFSIAGGEPLIHPHIVELVAFMAEQGIKPVILTNGIALTPELLHELKKAGLAGFTMHIDSHQNRPHWKDKSEKDHNELRQKIADMVALEGGLYLVFNSTVYPDTFHEIPDVVRWGQANIEKVQGLVFITYRTATTSDNIATDKNDQAVDISKLSYTRESFDEHFITAPEVYQIIKDHFPDYEASGYLGGSIRHDSYKWLIGAMLGNQHQMYGSLGKKTMELAQTGHHLWTGRYLAYPSTARIGPKIFWLAPWDKILRQARKKWTRDVLQHPARLFDGIYTQSIGIIQAPDLLPDGRADMCDSCPDITIYDGKFINSCRMDEYRLFGGFVSVLEKKEEKYHAMNQKLGLIEVIRSLARLLSGKPKVPPSLAGNSMLQVILNRRSIRSFTPQAIPEDVFAAILEAGRLAPSTVNLQTWAFAVFDAALWQQTFGQSLPFHGSRAVIVIADTYRDRQVLDVFPYSPLVQYSVAVMNASLAAMNMNIAAEVLGISSVMLSETGRSGLLDAKYLKETLCLPEGTVPLMTIVFGYARGPYPPMPPKLPAEQVFFKGQYQPPDRETMESWLSQMVAGYKASHLRSSFQKQVSIYQQKIGQAETDLREMIFYRERDSNGD